ncbi:phosphopantetheine-binding protein [Kitasatospora sp. NPDC087314]|uniref:phosphopantetheine-binding protein n=1 Tax=Kitasatospora sp. NPDC087314 TaxID=3364068 RepID=UPI00380F055D
MDRKIVQDIIRTELERLLGTAVTFGDDEPLVDHGLDSLLSVEFTLNLEDAFAIAFEDDELSFENFASLAVVTDLVQAKVSA